MFSDQHTSKRIDNAPYVLNSADFHLPALPILRPSKPLIHSHMIYGLTCPVDLHLPVQCRESVAYAFTPGFDAFFDVLLAV